MDVKAMEAELVRLRRQVQVADVMAAMAERVCGRAKGRDNGRHEKPVAATLNKDNLRQATAEYRWERTQ